MRVIVAQLNPTVGDLTNNVQGILAAYNAARDAGADVVVTPELAITGYPPRDLLHRPSFVRDAVAALRQIKTQARGPALIVGAVTSAHGDPLSLQSEIANAAVVLENGAVVACHRKMLLPTYDVFDEARYFTAGVEPTVATVGGSKIGISVCEDAWNDKEYWRTPRYARDPLAEQVAAGAQLLINISASPYDFAKPKERLDMLCATAGRHHVPLIYANQVGGNDSLLFDGRSLAIDARGKVAMSAPAFVVGQHCVTITDSGTRGECVPLETAWEADVALALPLGLRDYTRKCGFTDVVVGLSGGIDSALTAVIAVQALGAEHVLGVAMPSRYSSEGSLVDARDLAERLGIRFEVIGIEPVFSSYLEALAPAFRGRAPDVTEENLQARIRGGLLMALSNKLGSLLLTTGNKSELATGYCTLYGDMCGGLAVVSDLYKTQVYALSNYYNRTLHPEPIPKSSLTKPPSAELRPNQTDQDSLPPYPELDAILSAYIEKAQTPDELVALGFDRALVRRIGRMLDVSEYKRRQMPPGLRVTRKAFGEGRRFPIAQRYSF